MNHLIRKTVAHRMRAPSALLRIALVSMQEQKYARMDAPNTQGVRRMTKIQVELLKAQIRVELGFKIPPYISSPEEWASAIEASTDVVMDIIEKHIKESAE